MPLKYDSNIITSLPKNKKLPQSTIRVSGRHAAAARCSEATLRGNLPAIFYMRPTIGREPFGLLAPGSLARLAHRRFASSHHITPTLKARANGSQHIAWVARATAHSIYLLDGEDFIRYEYLYTAVEKPGKPQLFIYCMRIGLRAVAHVTFAMPRPVMGGVYRMRCILDKQVGKQVLGEKEVTQNQGVFV